MKKGINCIQCKGKLLCGLNKCPVFEKINTKETINDKLKKDFRSITPEVLIGWHNYPQVNAGIIAPYEIIKTQEPREWVLNKTPINEIMNYRLKLINSHNKVNIKELKGFNELIQQTALSSKPLNIDISLKNKPIITNNFDIHAQPYGPSGDVNRIELIDKPTIKKAVQITHYDTDLKANEAINYLKNKGLEEYEISNLLSAGTIGIEKNRKLVPTRWSITATDDSISKENINKIKQNEIIDTYTIFNGRYLGNNFTIILLPRLWSYELIEMWQPGAVFSSNETQVMTDYEEYNGRKEYAASTGGGYYASRLPITEWLIDNKTQAAILTIRQITKDYYMPLGVWVVREAVRKTLKNQPKKFSDYTLAKEYITRITGYDIRKTRTINNTQTRINNYL